MLEKINKISGDITKKYNEFTDEYRKICNAHMFALLLHYIIYKDYTDKDIVEFIYSMMKNDATLKNYVYDYMKEIK